jgi:hypothetical protein
LIPSRWLREAANALDAKDAEIAELRSDNEGMLNAGGYEYLSSERDRLQREVFRLKNATDMLVKERADLQAQLAEARAVVERFVSRANQAEYDSGPLMAELPWDEIVSAEVFLYGDPNQAEAAEAARGEKGGGA